MTDPSAPDPTTHFVRAAVAGDEQGIDALIERFTPFLLAQARYRLAGPAAGHCEPEDIVQETWAIALPRLADLRARDGRLTPVLMKFLATTLLRCTTQVLRKQVLRRPRVEGGGGLGDSRDPLQQLPAERSGVVSRVCRRDDIDSLWGAIARLPAEEREVLVLRGIERHANGEVARMLGIDDSVVTRRFQRALAMLRTAFPDSLAEDLDR